MLHLVRDVHDSQNTRNVQHQWTRTTNWRFRTACVPRTQYRPYWLRYVTPVLMPIMWLLHWQNAPKINALYLDFCGQNVSKVPVFRSDGRSVCATENTTNDKEWSVAYCWQRTQRAATNCSMHWGYWSGQVDRNIRDNRKITADETVPEAGMTTDNKWCENGRMRSGGWRTTLVGWPWLLRYSQITVWTTGVRFSEKAGPTPRNHVQTGCVVHPISYCRPTGSSRPNY